MASQMALQAAPAPGWSATMQLPVVDLVGRTWALGKKAKKIDTLFVTDAKSAAKKIEELFEEQRLIWNAATELGIGSWKVICTWSRCENIDDLLADLDEAASRATRYREMRRV